MRDDWILGSFLEIRSKKDRIDDEKQLVDGMRNGDWGGGGKLKCVLYDKRELWG